MPSAEELDQLVTERMDAHLDPWEISRLHQMMDAVENDPWKEGEDGEEAEAPELAR